MQPCAPGTQNAPAEFYSGDHYDTQAAFCGVNLISEQYMAHYGIDPHAKSVGYSQQPTSYQSYPSYPARSSYGASIPSYYPSVPQSYSSYRSPSPSYSLPSYPASNFQSSFSPLTSLSKPKGGYPTLSVSYKPVVMYGKPSYKPVYKPVFTYSKPSHSSISYKPATYKPQSPASNGKQRGY